MQGRSIKYTTGSSTLNERVLTKKKHCIRSGSPQAEMKVSKDAKNRIYIKEEIS